MMPSVYMTVKIHGLPYGTYAKGTSNYAKVLKEINNFLKAEGKTIPTMV